MTAAVLLVAATLASSPLRSAADLDARFALASAVLATDATAHEAALLMNIARYESEFSPAVFACRRWVNPGGAFQLVAPRRVACADLPTQAREALSRVRSSLAACSRLAAPERLSQYTRGTCTSRRGRALSRVRWVAE